MVSTYGLVSRDVRIKVWLASQLWGLGECCEFTWDVFFVIISGVPIPLPSCPKKAHICMIK